MNQKSHFESLAEFVIFGFGAAILLVALNGCDKAPPPPTPTIPDTRPVPASGLQVLFVVETQDLSKLPPAQVAVLGSTEIRKYLNSKGAKYLILDKDQDAAAFGSFFGKAKDAPSLPYLFIQNDKGGYAGGLPANVEATLKLLKEFGG